MPTIKVRVSGKIAENLTPEVKIVCRNSDYKVEFEFDEPWQAHELKTALFVYNGASVPVPFSGNVCEMPELYNTTLCAIGVFAGDLITTTPAYVDCLKAISDLGGEIPPPTEDVYNKLVQMIESGMLKGDKGDKGEKGDKGDAGAIKFITVVALPTENIQDDAIYLVPIENPDGENRFTEYAYIDGKWETLGAISIQVDHSEYVKFTDYATATKAGVVKVDGNFGVSATYATDENILSITPANRNNIAKKEEYYSPIVPQTLDYAVKVGVTTNTETLTDTEKADACEWLGAATKEEVANAVAPPKWELINTVTVVPDTDGSLPQYVNITEDSNGNPFELDQFFVRIKGGMTDGKTSTLWVADNNGKLLGNADVKFYASELRYVDVFAQKLQNGVISLSATFSGAIAGNTQVDNAYSRYIPAHTVSSFAPTTKVSLYTTSGENKTWLEGSTFELWGVRK